MKKLNKIDRNILRTLQADGRISYAELARQVGLTTTPCIERVRRLAREGIIAGFTALLNPPSVLPGLSWQYGSEVDVRGSRGFPVYGVPERCR